MQMKNEERIFISEDLEDLIDLNNLTDNSYQEKDFEFYIEINNQKLSVLSLDECNKKYKLTFMSSQNTLQTLISNSDFNIKLCLGNKELKVININKHLSKKKIKFISKNNYKIKIVILKEQEI